MKKLVLVVIDAMKPAALSFVAPGMAKEYGLKAATNPHGGLPVSLLPLCGIGGTVLGSLMWGWLADRIGRRKVFIATVINFSLATGALALTPDHGWLYLCGFRFLVGLGVGGL